MMIELSVEQFSVGHIYKGPGGARTLTDMAIVCLNSNGHREEALKTYEKDPNKFKKDDWADLKIDRAKTLQQLNRNNALRKAADLFKQKVSGNFLIEIVWKKEGSKDREVQVDKNPAFRQTIDDSKGIFLDPYTALQV